MGIISLWDTKSPLVPLKFVLFQANFKKNAFRLFDLNRHILHILPSQTTLLKPRFCCGVIYNPYILYTFMLE